MSEVRKIFYFLTPKILISIDKKTLLQKCNQFQNKYSDVVRPKFSLQFLNIYHLILSELTEACSVHQFRRNYNQIWST